MDPSNTGYWSSIFTQCWTNIDHDIGPILEWNIGQCWTNIVISQYWPNWTRIGTAEREGSSFFFRRKLTPVGEGRVCTYRIILEEIIRSVLWHRRMNDRKGIRHIKISHGQSQKFCGRPLGGPVLKQSNVRIKNKPVKTPKVIAVMEETFSCCLTTALTGTRRSTSNTDVEDYSDAQSHWTTLQFFLPSHTIDGMIMLGNLHSKLRKIKIDN